MSADQNLIYVGDLPLSVDETFIKNLFAEFGVNNVVLKNAHSGLSKFAFLTMDSRESCTRAITELNYTKLDGIPIRISYADNESKRIRKQGLGNLFIRGLDESIEVSQLHEAFSNFGEILSCKIPLTDGKSRGYAYIQFRNPEDANRAKNDLADASINGHPITIENYVKQQRKNPAETFTNVYVKNLPPSINSNEKLRELFIEYGEVQNPYIMNDAEGKPNGIGFCNMVRHEDAVKAIEALNDKTFPDSTQPLIAVRAMTKAERQAFIQQQTRKWKQMIQQKTRNRNLFVRGFDAQVTEDDLRAYFSQYGEIESLIIQLDSLHNSRKFGMVCFTTEEAARAAIEGALLNQLNGQRLYVGLFEDKETHQRKIAAQRKVAQAQPPMAMGMPMQGMPMMQGMPIQGMMPMQGMMPVETAEPVTAKAGLKQHLIAQGIVGADLKAKLTSVSEEQAERILANQEMLDKWLTM